MSDLVPGLSEVSASNKMPDSLIFVLSPRCHARSPLMRYCKGARIGYRFERLFSFNMLSFTGPTPARLYFRDTITRSNLRVLEYRMMAVPVAYGSSIGCAQTIAGWSHLSGLSVVHLRNQIVP